MPTTLQKAWLIIKQQYHIIPEKKGDAIVRHIAPNTHQIFPLDFDASAIYIIGGRIPKTNDSERGIAIPNQSVTSLLARITCAEFHKGFHIIQRESTKSGQFILNETTGLPVSKHVLADRDRFSVNNLPIEIIYRKTSKELESDIMITLGS